MMSKALAVVVVVAMVCGIILCSPAVAQDRSPPLFGSYYQGSTNYRARFYTDRDYMKMVMSCRADYWFTVDEKNQVHGAGLAIFDFDFSFDWPLIIKQGLKDANAFGTALDPNVAIMLQPGTKAHRFDLTGVFTPAQPPSAAGGKAEPAKVELKLKWQEEKADLHLINGGSPAGSGIPVAVGQRPAEGSVKQDLHIPRMYPFGNETMTVQLDKVPGSDLLAGRDDFDKKETARHITIYSVVEETINYAAARNPANNFLVSPVGLYEGFISQHTRYHTDRECIGMLLGSRADLWLTVDERGKIQGEVLAEYELDFGVDWTLATKTGISMAKALYMPIDPSVSVVLDPQTARQRFTLEGELQAPRPGAPLLLAPEMVRLNLKPKPNRNQKLRIIALGELSGAASPTVAGTAAAAATAGKRVIKSTVYVDAPSPFGAFSINVGLARRTPYGPYAAIFHLDDASILPNTHCVVDAFIKQQPIRAELSACPREWVPDLMTASGTSVKFEARLVGPDKRPAKWKFTIEDSSRLRGMCNNADLPTTLIRQWQNKITNASEDLLFDFRRYDGTREPRFKDVLGPAYNILETKEASSDPVKFEVSCLDFGAYGRLIAEADFGYGWQRAIVRQTGEPVAHIPYASNFDEAERHMAQAAKTYEGQAKFAGLLPEPDLDAKPLGNGFGGDGLSNFEEYRGFFVREGNQQVHRRLDPDRKDLFVFMSKITGQRLARHLPDFERASQLKVHRVGNDPLTKYVQVDSRLINFNSEEDRSKPQTALRLTIGPLPGGVVGSTIPPDTGYGPPVNVQSVQVNWATCMRIEALNRPYTVNFTKNTTMHELGHGVGMRHHGDTNQYVDGELVAMEGGQNSGNFACAMRYADGDRVRHFHEAPRAPAPPAPPRGALEELLFQGSLLPDYEKGLHKYPLALERNGLAFCTNSAATGINKAIPISEEFPSGHAYLCGPATRGNCLSQIVVNDRFGSGGRGNARRESALAAAPLEGPAALPPAAGVAPPAEQKALDEAETAAVQSQADAGLSLDLAFADESIREIVPGEAVIFDLHVGQFTQDAELGAADNAGGIKRVTRLGAPGASWTSQVTFELLDATGKFVAAPLALVPLGKVVQTSAADPAPGTQPALVAPLDASQLRLDADLVYTAGFAADGAATARLLPGKYRMFAAVKTNEPGLPERVLSGSVVLVVKNEADLPEDQQRQVDPLRKLSEAKLALRAERFADCEKLCRAAIAAVPESCEAQVLLAQALHRQQRLREALDAYQASLACLQPQLEGMPEPPRAIQLAIHALEEELGIKRKPAKVEREPGPLVDAEFFAETADGKDAPPFAPGSRRIAFSWRASASALTGPLEARWIAADVPGLARATLLKSSKSEEGQVSGQFELQPPEGGFAPGAYRLEIGMAGKRQYLVSFQVREELAVTSGIVDLNRHGFGG